MTNRAIAIGVTVLACACGPSSNGNPGHDGVDATSGGGGGGGAGDGEGCSKMDLLFVIDDSGSMVEEQENLIANFPAFITVLDQSGLDYRVAVTTVSRDYSYQLTVGGVTHSLSTEGESGEMLMTGAMTKRWIDKGDPDVSATFSMVAAVGTNGNGLEMPLGAMRDAFEDRMQDGTNSGFRRSDALLAIVIVTDENDCSYEQSAAFTEDEFICETKMEPAASYKAFLDQYTGSPTRWAAAIIAGAGPGSCSSPFGDAVEATRLIEFKAAVGANAIMSSICDGDLSVGLMQATKLFESACGGIIL